MVRAFSRNDARRHPGGVKKLQGTARAYPARNEVRLRLRMATWNVGSLTGRLREITDVMQKRCKHPVSAESQVEGAESQRTSGWMQTTLQRG